MKFHPCKKTLILVLGLTLSLFGCDRLEWDRSEQAHSANKRGIEALEAGNAAEAQRQFAETIGHEPDQSVYQFNLGTSLHVSQQADDALKAYESASEMTDAPSLQFLSNFNRAQILAQAKEYEKALGAYQSALDTNPPKELARETRVNIELLTQQMQNQGEGGEDQKDSEEKDKKGDEQKQADQGKEEQEKKYEDPRDQKQNQPKDGKQLSENDVRRIFEELTRQEQKIRAEFNKEESKDDPETEKDW